MNEKVSTIGAAVRRARAERHLSGRTLASLAGMSQSFLSNVENDRTTPSVPSLYALAEALGVGPSELLPESGADAQTVPAGHAAPLPASDSPAVPPVVLQILAAAKGRAIEAYLITQRADFVDTKAYGHTGEDLIYILDGRVELVRRNERIALRKGDLVWLDATTEHAFTTPKRTGVAALLISIR